MKNGKVKTDVAMLNPAGGASLGASRKPAAADYNDLFKDDKDAAKAGGLSPEVKAAGLRRRF